MKKTLAGTIKNRRRRKLITRIKTAEGISKEVDETEIGKEKFPGTDIARPTNSKNHYKK